MFELAEQIEGLMIRPLQQFHDHRGTLMHILRNDSPFFTKFGEVYCSSIKPNGIKAWRRCKSTVQNLAVPVGRIQLVIYDDRPDSSTHGELIDIVTGSDQYLLIQIPPMLWFGFQCLGPGEALIVNCTDTIYDTNDIDRIEYNDPYVPYQWQR